MLSYMRARARRRAIREQPDTYLRELGLKLEQGEAIARSRLNELEAAIRNDDSGHFTVHERTPDCLLFAFRHVGLFYRYHHNLEQFFLQYGHWHAEASYPWDFVTVHEEPVTVSAGGLATRALYTDTGRVLDWLRSAAGPALHLRRVRTEYVLSNS